MSVPSTALPCAVVSSGLAQNWGAAGGESLWVLLRLSHLKGFTTCVEQTTTDHEV